MRQFLFHYLLVVAIILAVYRSNLRPVYRQQFPIVQPQLHAQLSKRPEAVANRLRVILIPNAVNIPNESIGTEEIPALPDKNQLILVYCRSGNRSKQASEKLAALGYTNIVEFGGINSWPGETVSGEG